MIVIILGFILTVVGSIILGTFFKWVTSLIFMASYFIIVASTYFINKYLQNRQLRQAHFVLAIFCRAENNRIYLHRNVEMRPGFLATWIEFLQHTPPQDEELNEFDSDWLLKKIQQRVLPERFMKHIEQENEEDSSKQPLQQQNPDGSLLPPIKAIFIYPKLTDEERKKKHLRLLRQYEENRLRRELQKSSQLNKIVPEQP